ncbi:ABC transporter ATP-binding protein [Actinoplanes friuliensis]|uniref:Lipid ABC transporter ATPase/inner membrane protein n=1 Tax=Actinoplanes friuliensis DSM 7358 TaxID=1246995 RepID=U5W4R9_9ACTN|nr:ABC transporter ATP-binding protein [Actinoplanes friuliensis]AGZ42995.1 lipid ABC transporter ATPase/inner membrane protein [Actinoplanes friuliensis DSM 7358]
MTQRQGLLGQALGGQRRWIVLSTLMITGHQAGEVAVPFLIGVVIDQAVTGDAGDLALWLGVIGAVYLGLSYSYRYGERFGERASEQAAHELRLRVTRRVLDDRGGAETDRLPGALVSIATSDAARVGAVAVAVSSGVAAVVGLSFAAVLLLSISVPLGLLVLLGTPPLMGLTRLLGKPLEERSETEQEHGAQASGTAADLVAGLRVVKGLRAGPAAVTRYRERSRGALAATVRAARAEAAYQGVVLSLSGLFLAVIAVAGGILAVRGEITVGQLISSVGLAQFLVGPMSTFGWVGADLAQGRASARRVAAVLDMPAAVTGGDASPSVPVRGAIRIHGLADPPLRALDLEITPGELVGIVAADPAEAAALVRLLGRSCDPAGGVIELDGVALTELAPDGLRSAVLSTEHHTDLFGGTIRSAVSLSGRARPETVEAAVITAGADEVAGGLPDGLDAVLDDGARSLSGGQRQRIALARALAADPPVLVVHDPTTAVDAVTESRIAGRLREMRAGRTTILVTTSPALLAVTDRVIVLHDGAVRADGTHGDLVAGDSTYRETVLS